MNNSDHCASSYGRWLFFGMLMRWANAFQDFKLLAVKCMCQVFVKRPTFNFSQNIVGVLIPLIAVHNKQVPLPATSISTSMSLYNYVSLHLYLCLSTSISLPLYLYASLPLCLYLYLSTSMYIYASLPLCLYLYVYVSPPICLYLYVSNYMTLTL